MHHQACLIGGHWESTDVTVPVTNKFSGQVLGHVVQAGAETVDRAIAAAAQGAAVMRDLPAHARADLLGRVAAMLRERREPLAHLIAAEAGKALRYARLEVERAADTFLLASEEARRIHGETVPLDGLPSGQGHVGFWRRRPVGIIAAITPFNFPLNLVAHKVAPALAAGNSIVLKPASATPLSAGKLCEILMEAGLPAGGINLICGRGQAVGHQLVLDRRVGMVSFTGSVPAGEAVVAAAGIKKVSLELGNNAPVVVAADADLDAVVERCVPGAYACSGQVCISVQRVYADRRIYPELRQRFIDRIDRLVVGDPLDEQVEIGPMIDEREADRVMAWVQEAREQGAQMLSGGRRSGAVVWPILLADVQPTMRVVREEVFGPVMSLLACDDFEHGLRLADAGDYGLQAAVFTRDLDRALRAAHRLNFGGVIINDTPSFRSDAMPYGGTRHSGLGREGVRFAVEAMSQIQMVAIRSDVTAPAGG